MLLERVAPVVGREPAQVGWPLYAILEPGY